MILIYDKSNIVITEKVIQILFPASVEGVDDELMVLDKKDVGQYNQEYTGKLSNTSIKDVKNNLTGY